MKKNKVGIIRSFLIFVLTIILIFLGLSTYAQTKSKTPLQIFKSRPIWENLPSNFLELLANRLKSVENTNEFIQICETSGILKNNIIRISNHPNYPESIENPEFMIASVASTLTSYANALGRERKFKQAKRPLEFTILLKPRHLPAWSSMALTAMFLGDCQNAEYWADKVLFKPDPNSKDAYEQGLALSMTPEGEKVAAEALGHSINFKEIQNVMKMIKDDCRK